MIAYNGVCWGGTSLRRHQVNSHFFGYDEKGRCTFLSEFDVCLEDELQATKDDELTTLQDLLHAQGIFAVAYGQRWLETDGVVSGTTLTSDSDPFLESDVGMPISIRGVGCFQIASYTATDEVELTEAPGDDTGLTIYMGYGQPPFNPMNPADLTKGNNLQPKLTFPGSPDDTGLSWLARFELTWTQPQDQAEGSSGEYRQTGAYDVVYGRSGHKRVIFSGVYTFGDEATARENYATYFPTWRNSVLSSLGITNWEVAPGTEKVGNNNPFGDTCPFSVVIQELTAPQQDGSWDSSSVQGLTMRFTRRAAWRHGKPGKVGPVMVTAFWDSSIAKSQVAWDAILGLYTGIIKPRLLSVLKSRYGASKVYELEEVGPEEEILPDGYGVRGSITCLIVGGSNSGDKILEWVETTNYFRNERKSYADVHDGLPGTTHRWVTGYVDFATHEVFIRSVDKAFRVPSSSWKPPMDPPFSASGGGEWDNLNEGWQKRNFEIGRDPEGKGSVGKEYYSNFAGAFRWVPKRSKTIKPLKRIPTKKVSTGDGRVATHGVQK